jgi:hypothetical protein
MLARAKKKQLLNYTLANALEEFVICNMQYYLSKKYLNVATIK